MTLGRMKFGIFLAPFHRVGENPTLAFQRNLELIEWLDQLGYDEAWIGEHHSAGWETIASPELMIAAAAERTKFIKLGSGVTSLPYHHPFLVAQRFVQLDHMTRGRTMLGCGPGALTSDAYMLGIEAVTQRPRMDEALDAIMRLLDGEIVSVKTDWFELREARLHLRPFTEPRFPIAVASTLSPAGMVAAGRHGLGVLSIGAGLPGGQDALAQHWGIAEEAAAEAGKTMDRRQWRLVMPVHVAESRAQAIQDVEAGRRSHSVDYFRDTLGRPPGPNDESVEKAIDAGAALVGDPDDVAAGIERLLEQSRGGFGALLCMAHEWAEREPTLRSYELLARYVAPRFQGQLESITGSRNWVRENRRTIFSPNGPAIMKAFADANRPLPPEWVARMEETRRRAAQEAAEREAAVPGDA